MDAYICSNILWYFSVTAQVIGLTCRPTHRCVPQSIMRLHSVASFKAPHTKKLFDKHNLVCLEYQLSKISKRWRLIFQILNSLPMLKFHFIILIPDDQNCLERQSGRYCPPPEVQCWTYPTSFHPIANSCWNLWYYWRLWVIPTIMPSHFPSLTQPSSFSQIINSLSTQNLILSEASFCTFLL